MVLAKQVAQIAQMKSNALSYVCHDARADHRLGSNRPAALTQAFRGSDVPAPPVTPPLPPQPGVPPGSPPGVPPPIDDPRPPGGPAPVREPPAVAPPLVV